MKIFFTCIAMCIVLLSLANAETTEKNAVEHAEVWHEVWRSDGSLQCGVGPTLTLVETITEVENAGIEVIDAREAHDGFNRIAMCGASTGQIHILTIPAKSVSDIGDLDFETFTEANA